MALDEDKLYKGIKEKYYEYAVNNNPGYKYWYKKGITNKTSWGIEIPDDEEEVKEAYYRDLLRFNKQSLAFYSEVIPLLFECVKISKIPLNNSYTFLDIGTRSGAGANLIGEMFSDERVGYPLKFIVDTIDINKDWNDYLQIHPFIRNHSNTNLFDLKDNTYDVCFCSHTIEHLDNPIDFVMQAKKVSIRFAFFTCPYEENDPIPGHHTVTKEIIDACNPFYFRTYDSINKWRDDLKCVVFAV